TVAALFGPQLRGDLERALLDDGDALLLQVDDQALSRRDLDLNGFASRNGDVDRVALARDDREVHVLVNRAGDGHHKDVAVERRADGPELLRLRLGLGLRVLAALLRLGPGVGLRPVALRRVLEGNRDLTGVRRDRGRARVYPTGRQLDLDDFLAVADRPLVLPEDVAAGDRDVS